ncbi:MAG TPA: Rieske (2Fe-2S) protein, partial [Gemmatimonadaceae bacterium]|nr:Rieske (2Fe-2S) protein [Gemmatimonadaceae bacterium]
MSLRWTFNPNIARASTAPARLYTDPVFLELEQERIFGRMWQLAARTEQLAEEGNYVATEIGGERIVIVRGPDGLRGFHNICLHRAGPVAEGCGKRKTLQCRYHGWTYSLGGELIRAPEMEGTEGFVPAEMHLLPVQVEALGPLVFANLDPKAPPLADFVGDIPSRLSALRADRMR